MPKAWKAPGARSRMPRKGVLLLKPHCYESLFRHRMISGCRLKRKPSEAGELERHRQESKWKGTRRRTSSWRAPRPTELPTNTAIAIRWWCR